MGAVSGGTVEQGAVEARETGPDQPPLALIKIGSDIPGSSPTVRPGEANGPSMRPGLPAVTGPTKTMAQPRLRTQVPTGATDAFSGLRPDIKHKGADGLTPSRRAAPPLPAQSYP